MTNFSAMTDDELNEAILMRMGRVIIYESPYPPMTRIDGILVPVPDYTHDWRLCGELLEEMIDDDIVSMGIQDREYFCELIDAQLQIAVDAVSDTPQRAICEAWLAWKEEQECSCKNGRNPDCQIHGVNEFDEHKDLYSLP